MRCVDDRFPLLPTPQAEIDIAIDGKIFVKSTKRLEYHAPRQQTGPGNRNNIAFALRQTEVTGLVGGSPVKRIPYAVSRPEHPCLRYRAGGIQEARADGPDFVAHRV